MRDERRKRESEEWVKAKERERGESGHTVSVMMTSMKRSLVHPL